MPVLGSPLHLDMLRSSGTRSSWVVRLARAVKYAFHSQGVYGLEWGDPEIVEPLRFVRDRYVLPYVNPAHAAVEIGPGGGRWTRYLLGFGKLYAVDYHAELLRELSKNFHPPNLHFIKNNGTDFPGIAAQSIDYVFSFGCFVHLDTRLIEEYLQSLKGIVKSASNVVIHYSDKSKVMAQLNHSFSDNTPQKMRQIVLLAGFRIVEEDLTTMWHSSIIRFTR
ncbi:MAG TPA: class I SAM-dependent methyltransferase [Terriglobales bacterium]|nr:class I SAM-dependent methyltransferase [Terriglobales bacterium]